MSKIGKVWGTTECILSTPFIEVHRLNIEPQHECSLHKHKYKWNAFFVKSGHLFIDVEKEDYPLTDTTELGPGEFTTVRPGEFHRFRTANEVCECIEIYYPEALSEDIFRKNHGGMVNGKGKK